MKALVLAATILPAFAIAESSVVFSYGRCQRLSSAEQVRAEAVDSEIHEKAAEKAAAELQRRIKAPLTDRSALNPSNERLATNIRGWLLKRDLLSARTRREHDADEGVAYCEFILAEAEIK
jgi:hypothetical protein